MKELLYFSSSDLMIQVTYRKELNSIDYLSHRELSLGERVVVEQYLLTKIAVKTEYYKKHPAMLSYVGVDGKLMKNLNHFHLKNTISSLEGQDSEADGSVKNLIDQSLSNYYFEQIGNTLLEFRQVIKESHGEIELRNFAERLKELITAYNSHSEQVVTIEEVIPSDLKGFIE